MRLLDIGGGFSGKEDFEVKFEEVKQRKYTMLVLVHLSILMTQIIATTIFLFSVILLRNL